FASSANYHSLQVQVQRRMTKGLRFGAAFTKAKALGVSNAYTGQVSAYFAPRQRDYGPLNFDRSHSLSLNYTWDLPRPGARMHNRWAGAVADHWVISGICSFVSGSPFTPTFATTNASELSASTDAA